mmetsp:Transcript_8286/g.9088  ORF Transcript_8286/g.9088 Transcript_8286/m.9088 type:complete len:554 (+) Transcript_8286:1-1662(+)
MKSGGLNYLKQLPPWHLLDVDREAAKGEVKARFRELSKLFHPDKKGGAIFHEVFILLQAAYEGLKNSDLTEKEAFKANAEVEAQLYAHSKYVVELLPSHWKEIEFGTKTKYVINVSNTSSIMKNSTIDDVQNITSTIVSEKSSILSNEETSPRSAQVWLVLLYSPRCGMSRMVPPLLELAAEHLTKEGNIRVGAYGCGIYGESLQSSKEKGFAAWNTDPICKQFKRKETPNTHVIVEALSDDVDVMERAHSFSNFYAEAAHGTSVEVLPRRLINFAQTSYDAWEDSTYIHYMRTEDFDSNEFIASPSIVIYTEAEADAHEVQDAILAIVPVVAKRLSEANAYVGVAICGSEIDDDPRFVDCSKLDVSWLPDVKIYQANQTTGLSLLSDNFVDRRDTQIALESMMNTFIALYGLGEQSHFQEDQDDLGEEPPKSGSCSAGSFQQPFESNNEDFVKIDSPPDMEEIESPPNPEEENLNLGENEETERIDDSSGKPKLAEKSESNNESQKPRLAKRAEGTKTLNRINRDERRSSGHGRRGAVFQVGGSASGGAIGG